MRIGLRVALVFVVGVVIEIGFESRAVVAVGRAVVWVAPRSARVSSAGPFMAAAPFLLIFGLLTHRCNLLFHKD